MEGKQLMLVHSLPARFLIAYIEFIYKSDTGHQTSICLLRCRISNRVEEQAEPTSYLSQLSPLNRSLLHEKIVDSTPNNEDILMDNEDIMIDTIICTMIKEIKTYDHIRNITHFYVHQINESHIVLLYNYLLQ